MRSNDIQEFSELKDTANKEINLIIRAIYQIVPVIMAKNQFDETFKSGEFDSLLGVLRDRGYFWTGSFGMSVGPTGSNILTKYLPFQRVITFKN